MEPLRAAVIGVGNMGQNHARIYAQMPDVELVALVDKEKSRGSMVAKKFGVPRAYTSVAQLLRHEAIDVASIALPPQQNPRATMGLMQKGVHLLVEKPFTTTIADAKQMIARAQKAGVTVAVGYTEHFNPAVRAAKQVIERGTLGTIRFIRAQRIGVPTPRIRNVHIVLDIGVHDIEVIQYLVGRRPTRLHAVGRRVFDRGTDIATLDLEYGPVLASIELNKVSTVKKRTLEIFGTKGVLEIDYILQSVVFYPRQEVAYAADFAELVSIYGARPHSMRLDVRIQEPLQLEIEDFVNAVREKRAPQVTPQSALSVLETALRTIRSGSLH